MDDPSTPDYDAVRRRTERLVIGMAIGIPLLLAAWDRASILNDNSAFYAWAGWLLSTVKFHSIRSILLALSVWIAWRAPILGARILRNSTVAVAILSATVMAQIMEYYSLGTALPEGTIVRMLVWHVSMLLMSVAVMVFARRFFRIVLVRVGDSQECKSRRFSILELMLWTAVVAGGSAFVRLVDQWNQGMETAARLPTVFFALTFWTATVLPALPFVAIVICWKFKHWRARIWVPVTVVAYAILSTSHDVLQTAILKAYTDIPIATKAYLSGSQIFGHLRHSTLEVLTCLLVVYLMTKCGYRFRRTVRHNDTSESH